MSRNAWVIHISAVTLAQITRNAPKVVRKIYRPMDPIRLTRPRSRQSLVRRAPCPQRHPNGKSDLLCSLYVIEQQSGWAKAKPLSMHNKTLISGALLGGHRDLRACPRAAPRPGAREGLCTAPQAGSYLSPRCASSARFQAQVETPRRY